MTSSSKKTKAILKSIKQALLRDNATDLSAQLAELIKSESEQWVHLLYITNIIPNPDNKESATTVGKLLEAFGKLLQSTYVDIKLDDIVHVVQSMIILPICFSSIRERLETLDVWEALGITIIYRYAAFLEDQFYLMQKQANEDAKRQGYFNPMTLVSDIHMSDAYNTTNNLTANYEQHGEDFQLVLAYCTDKYGSKFWGEFSKCKSPYGDSEFVHLRLLATQWHLYKNLWGNIKYLDWRSENKYPVTIYAPNDRQELIRLAVGYTRTQQILFEITADFYQDRVICSDTLERIKILANSISFPSIGHVWNLELDVKIFADAIARSCQMVLNTKMLEIFHYHPLLDEWQFGNTPSLVLWKTYWRVLHALRILSNIFRTAAEQNINDKDIAAPLSRICLVDKRQLCTVISTALNIELEDCDAALNMLTFDPKSREMEVWDTPLVPTSDDILLFVPNIIENGNPVRTAENLISQWDNHLFDRRGKLLESEIYKFLHEIPGIDVQSPIIFKTGSGKIVECDLVAYWDGYLIFIEAKCTKTVFKPAEIYWAKQRIEGAIEQLRVRRESALHNWDKFRHAATSLRLPSFPPSTEKIKLVAATNILQFTGWKSQDVIVTDEFCIRRFFGPDDVEAYIGDVKLGTVARIRSRSHPGAQDFFRYLDDPPQVRLVQMNTKVDFMNMLTGKAIDPQIAMMITKYVAPTPNEMISQKEKQR